jgi:hypothetical protein
VLGVPGTPFALLLTRSADFAEYDKLLKLQLENEQDLRLARCLFLTMDSAVLGLASSGCGWHGARFWTGFCVRGWHRFLHLLARS